MPRRVGYAGASNVTSIGNPSLSDQGTFSLSTPAGWTMIWWGLSVLIILGMFMML